MNVSILTLLACVATDSNAFSVRLHTEGPGWTVEAVMRGAPGR
jgi:hypothetical protein